MIICPHCNVQLNPGDKFKEKFAALDPGQKVKVKCIKCAEGFAVEVPAEGGIPVSVAIPVDTKVKPPIAPDLSWLDEEVTGVEGVAEELPLALVLVPEERGRSTISKMLEENGFRVELAESSGDAIDKMEFAQYAAVILHAEFEPGDIKENEFYRFICRMGMDKRRSIFFVLIGEEFNTLYNLQALTYSANVVVNDNDIPYLETVWTKAMMDTETLFGPLLEEMQEQGLH